jgi:hypothetical protein
MQVDWAFGQRPEEEANYSVIGEKLKERDQG